MRPWSCRTLLGVPRLSALLNLSRLASARIAGGWNSHEREVLMPRTPAPLTVEQDHTIGADLWLVVSYAKTRVVVATFKSDADARAFVALPALIDLLKRAATLIEYDPGAKLSDEIAAALAQVDSPSPTDS
jgi:hypothetical protein